MKLVFAEHVLPFIENHANTSDDEIYGWLLGYEEKKELVVLAAYPCSIYKNQTLIEAEPDPQELSSLDSMLPLGISVLGIYHSHPSNVFHSRTDDKTILEMAQTDPNIVSVVTNGEISKVFVVKDKKIKEVNPKTSSKAVVDEKSFNYQTLQISCNLEKKDNYMDLADWIEDQVREHMDQHYQPRKEIIELSVDLTLDNARKLKFSVTLPIIQGKVSKEQIINRYAAIVYQIFRHWKVDIKKFGLLRLPFFGIPLIIEPHNPVLANGEAKAGLMKQFKPTEANEWIKQAKDKQL